MTTNTINIIEYIDYLTKDALPAFSKDCVMAGPDNLVDRTHTATLLDDSLARGSEFRVPVKFKFKQVNTKVNNVDTVITPTEMTSIKLKIEHQKYLRIAITTKQMTFEDKSFFANMVVPAFEAFGEDTELYIFDFMFLGTHNYVDLQGAATTAKDYAKVKTAFEKMGSGTVGKRKVILGLQAEEDFITIPEVLKANEKGNADVANLGYVRSYMGMDFYKSQLLDTKAAEVAASVALTTFTGAKIAKTIKKDDKSLVVSLKEATNGQVIKKYTILKTASGSFTATEDVTVASTVAEVPVVRVGYDFTIEQAVTVVNGIGYNFGFLPSSIILLQVSPDVLPGATTALQSKDAKTGISITSHMEFSNGTLEGNLVWTYFIGGRIGASEGIFRF